MMIILKIFFYNIFPTLSTYINNTKQNINYNIFSLQSFSKICSFTCKSQYQQYNIIILFIIKEMQNTRYEILAFFGITISQLNMLKKVQKTKFSQKHCKKLFLQIKTRQQHKQVQFSRVFSDFCILFLFIYCKNKCNFFIFLNFLKIQGISDINNLKQQYTVFFILYSIKYTINFYYSISPFAVDILCIYFLFEHVLLQSTYSNCHNFY
eukprot:TRINITY_DN4120_c0_g1_i21.p1 TRINITY_DN4120_c0_g1~~TRINITY_DN4120_c0_g1_i21.p1  ORF type:complete len:209 (-),score=-15.56 TRINITY_DN4120_c0_g1_i21:443-1069(-)